LSADRTENELPPPAWVAGIDIVKEELVRPLIGFEDLFERRHCLTKIRQGPAGISFQSAGSSLHEFC
jgi:hypothetical protein